ncbi:hypothetical protein EU805_06370 [Salipiger sp. IMCC34102]|uniref:hypothetical protein n=1 Tax=Salipiger sp. IMCC34102 TaxID=2510647 RepID=UPI00101C728D|nr:hypothetical protein [Salipiger sp. IMCC34102]RYH03344.1 hypothetical protein EU805_06370 [Salipiger sp. IMCC34102]
MKGDALDPGGLIAESYRIETLGPGECREIFLDWALKVAAGTDLRQAIAALLERHAGEPADHPMTETLRAGLADTAAPRRRGGRAGRAR